MYSRPFLRPIAIYPVGACPGTNSSCMQFYLIQNAPFVNELQGFPAANPGFTQKWRWDPAYLKAFQTPIFHVSLIFRLGRYSFEDSDCRMYGYPRKVFELCIKDVMRDGRARGTEIGIPFMAAIYLMELVASGCSGWANNDTLYCYDPSNYKLAKLVQIVVRKHKADITYNVYNTTIEEVGSISPAYGFEHAPAIEYLNFFDRIFPPAITPLPDDWEHDFTLENLLFGFCHGQIMASTDANVVQASFNELLLMPWVIQQYIEYQIGRRRSRI